jgi:hypothetical protein
MVAQVDRLPDDFVPFAELNVCSNLMKKGKAPFVLNGRVPLLIGKNSHPKIWLSTPKDSSIIEWIDLIVAGRTVHPDTRIFLSEDQTELSIQFRRQVVLELRLVSLDSVDLPFIDLRPIGLNIFGDSSVLHLGPHNLSRNSFTDVAFMANLGAPLPSSTPAGGS